MNLKDTLTRNQSVVDKQILNHLDFFREVLLVFIPLNECFFIHE